MPPGGGTPLASESTMKRRRERMVMEAEEAIVAVAVRSWVKVWRELRELCGGREGFEGC